MRLGFLEFVLIVIVLLSILVIWRWMRQGGTEETDDNSPPSFLQKIGTVGILLVVGGLGLILVGYIILVSLAKVFIWAVVILVLGLAFLVLSRR
ncbi:MAG: hypothetical protein TUN42_08765 [Dehalogenimonas sp.]